MIPKPHASRITGFGLFSRILFGCLGSFLILSSAAIAQPLSDVQKHWLSENIYAPKTGILFQIVFDRDRLDLGLEFKGDDPGDDLDTNDEGIVRNFIKESPLESGGYIDLFNLLRRQSKPESAFEELDAGLQGLLVAYDLDRDNYELISNAVSIFLHVRQLDRAILVLNAFVSNNPDHAESVATVAMFELLRGDREASRKHIDAAYKISPGERSIYMSEFMYQLISALQGLKDMGEEAATDKLDFKISTSFLQRAAKENPELILPKLSRHSMEITDILFETILNESERFLQEKAFKFDIPKVDRKRLFAAGEYFRTLLKQKPKNAILPLKFMIMTEVLQNDHDEALKFFRRAETHPLVDIDFFRIMAISAFRLADFEAAAAFMASGLKHKEEPATRMVLARFQSISEDHLGALETVSLPEAQMKGELRVGKLAYACKAGAWEVLLAERKKLRMLNPEKLAPNAAYYVGAADLVGGDRESAITMFKVALGDRYYRGGAEEIAEYFGLWD